MFPEWTAATRPKMKDSAQEDYTFGRQTVVQPADQKWLDNIMNYLRSTEGMKYGIGGAVGAGLLTQQESDELGL